MNVIIFSSENKNLSPLNCEVPDIMLPVGEIPCIEHLIRQFVELGASNICIVTDRMGREITGYVGDGRWLGVKNLTYCNYEDSSGNGSNLRRIDEYIDSFDCDETVVVVENIFFSNQYGNELKSLLEYHREKQNYVTTGVLQTKTDDLVGLYILNAKAKSSLSLYKINSAEDFNEAIEGVSNGKSLSYVLGERCIHIDSIVGYVNANQSYAENSMLHNNGKFLEKGIFVGTNTIIAENVKLVAPVVIGENCMIEGNCEIGNSVIGRGSIVGSTTRINDSVCWNNVSMGKNVSISESVVCSSVRLERNFTAKKAVIGNRSVCRIASAVIDGARLWPGSMVDSGCLVKSNIIDAYEDKIDFDEDCVKGCSFGKRTVAETVSRLGSALGTFFGPYTTVVVGCDGNNSSNMMSLSIAAGLAGSGVKVKYIKDSVLPVLRWVCRHGLADGGIFISSTDDTEFNILNTHGNDLSKSERNLLQKIYVKNELITVGEDSIEAIEEMANPEDYYTAYISDIFSEAYRNLCLGNVSCTREAREAVTAYVISKLYPNAPLFVSASSSLATEVIARRDMKKTVKCGPYRGDVMEAMEKYMKTEGVYQQYLMLYDEFAFELAISHFKAITGEDPFVKADIPNIYKKTVSIDFHSSKRDEIYGKLRGYLNITGDFEENDGVVDSCDNGSVRIIPDSIRPRIRITVESFDEEYAEDMTEKFTQIINECTE